MGPSLKIQRGEYYKWLDVNVDVVILTFSSFIPERWEAPTESMKHAFMPFGRGSRGKLALKKLIVVNDWNK
jgi:hypothetical protein